MSDKNIFTITENNYHIYKDAVIVLYQSVFAEKPYCEEFSKKQVQKIFEKILIYKHNKIVVKMVDGIPVSFCVGYSAYCEKDNYLKPLCEKKSLDLRKYFYIAELGTDKNHLNNGYAKELLNNIIHSNTNQYSYFLVRTTENNDISLYIYSKFHFNKIDGVYDSVMAERTDGSERVDRRVYLLLDVGVKKIGYMQVRTIKIKKIDEKLVDANHYDKDILLEKAQIGLFPYGNDNEYIKVRETVAKKLAKISKKLMNYAQKEKKDYRLNICYGYRSKDVQTQAFGAQRRKMAKQNLSFDSIYDFVEGVHRYIAVPTIAGHPTGGAVDVSVKDMENDRFLDMGSLIYEFSSDKVRWGAEGLTIDQKKNRQLLFNLMTAEGFAPFWGEWWHYSYGDNEWAAYYEKKHAIYNQIESANVIVFTEAGGNPTALVASKHSPESHELIGKKLIEISKDWDVTVPIEQVAFLLEKRERAVRFRMAGGEMCGNALIALGAYAKDMKDGIATVTICLEDKTNNLHPKRFNSLTEKGVTKIDYMKDFSLEEKIENRDGATIVHLDGISHVVIPVDEFKKREDEEIRSILDKYDLLEKPASGVMFVREYDNKFSLDPYVYVRDLGSMTNETACGSGSIAAGICKVLKENNDITELPVIQKTGHPIFVTISRSSNILSAIVSAEVSLLYEGIVSFLK